MSTMEVGKEEINLEGKYVWVNSVRINTNVLVITGSYVKTASIKEEWFEDIEDPEELISTLKKLKKRNLRADIFTFWERFPEGKPKYRYYMEWEKNSVMPIKTFNHWWKKQITKNVRKKNRKAQKKGVVVKIVDFNDELVKGIMNIFDETPIRQNKPFWHHGKDFDTVKKEMSRDLDRSDFIGAYYNDHLIGFIKLIYADKLAYPVQSISMIEHNDKAPNNALIAKAVEICEKKKIPHFIYGPWRRGSHAHFLSSNGFEKVLFPRYYVPLTLKGKIILKLKLHHGIFGLLPEKVMVWLLALRKELYTRKYRKYFKKEEAR